MAMYHDLASMRAALENADVLRKIFQYLDFPEDVCRLALVSRTWRDTAAAPEFWRVIDVWHQDMHPDVLCAILRRHYEVRSLNARHVELTTEHLAEVLPLLTNLVHLELEKNSVYSTRDNFVISKLTTTEPSPSCWRHLGSPPTISRRTRSSPTSIATTTR
ncbi:MAG: F-box protein [Taibaiella sp.]|nr:F-box protein [Taibaiella sp.]